MLKFTMAVLAGMLAASSAASCELPDIVGMPYADARKAMIEAGFEPVTQMREQRTLLEWTTAYPEVKECSGQHCESAFICKGPPAYIVTQHEQPVVEVIAAWVDPSPPADYTPLSCLHAAAMRERDFSECRGLVFNACIDRIINARGNPGTSAGISCRTEELSGWLEAWAFYLFKATWPVAEGDSVEAAIARFTEVQVTANAQCMPQSEATELAMVQISDCMSDFYSDFLIEEAQIR